MAGYLRNVRGDKGEDVVKHFEHNLFRANLPDAVQFLAGRERLTYADFLEVHRILFSAYYPWAGQDRAITLPDSLISKGDIQFVHADDAKVVVDEGLRLGQITATMNARPGRVMGLFAYGHPFLDGNGRTMLLVHLELTYRAGFSIAWTNTNEADYLSALSDEIRTPNQGILDRYLLPFKGARVERQDWGKALSALKGLDGLDDGNQVDGVFSDPAIAEKYRKFDEKRGYSYTTLSLAETWNAIPATTAQSGTIMAVSDLEVIQSAGQGKYVVWPRQKLSGYPIEEGKSADISADGTVKEPRSKDHGLGM
jgi:cell filamentation protein